MKVVDQLNQHHIAVCAEFTGYVGADFKGWVLATMGAAVQRAHSVMVDTAFKRVRMVQRGRGAAISMGRGC